MVSELHPGVVGNKRVVIDSKRMEERLEEIERKLELWKRGGVE